MTTTRGSVHTSVGSRIAIVALAAIAAVSLAVVALLFLGVIPTAAGQPASGVADITSSIVPGVPTIVTEQQLRELGSTQGVVYWAGPDNDRAYEVTHMADGTIYVRYLSKDAKAGTNDQYLTVVTYPQKNAFALLQSRVDSGGATGVMTETGALVAVDKGFPKSTYFAFPGVDVQVEVFAPKQDESHNLVLDGSIVLLGTE